MKKNKIFSLIIILIVCSCNRTFDSKEELVRSIYGSDGDYEFRDSLSSVSYTLRYRPTDLMASQEIDHLSNLKENETIRQKYNKYLYFDLSMSVNNQEVLNAAVTDNTQFSQILNELAFNISENVHLYSDRNDTIPLVDFIYPRMYGMSNSTALLIAFRRDSTLYNCKSLYMTINAFGISDKEVIFEVDPKLIIKEPSINF